MKYKILLILMVVGTLFCHTSCHKLLYLEPQFKFADSVALNSMQGLYLTTTGAFSSLQSGSLYGGGTIAYSELLASFVNTPVLADFSLNELRIHQMDPTNAEANGLWDAAYRSILISNLVLQNLPKYQNANNTDTANLIKGECLFIRGAMHFELVRNYAQPYVFGSPNTQLGVPIDTTPGNLTANQSAPRSTVAQVYQQVISDLTRAESLLPSKASIGLNTFAFKYSAQGFLTRVYFEEDNWSMAQAWADSVINTSGLSIDATVGTVDSLSGNVSSNEIIFQCISAPPNDEVNGPGAPLSSYFQISGTSAAFTMSPAFVDTFLIPYAAAGDLRVKNLYHKSPYGIWTCKKYNDYYMNIPIMRLEEVILDRAECENQQGNYGAARTDLDLIMTHAGVTPDNSSTGAGQLKLIRQQRDMELSMEGDRLFELKRRQWNFTAGYDSTVTIQWNSNNLIYPIPLQEVQKNSQMVQNPGY